MASCHLTICSHTLIRVFLGQQIAKSTEEILKIFDKWCGTAISIQNRCLQNASWQGCRDPCRASIHPLRDWIMGEPRVPGRGHQVARKGGGLAQKN